MLPVPVSRAIVLAVYWIVRVPVVSLSRCASSIMMLFLQKDFKPPSLIDIPSPACHGQKPC
jgi:hypothetical protein